MQVEAMRPAAPNITPLTSLLWAGAAWAPAADKLVHMVPKARSIVHPSPARHRLCRQRLDGPLQFEKGKVPGANCGDKLYFLECGIGCGQETVEPTVVAVTPVTPESGIMSKAVLVVPASGTARGTEAAQQAHGRRAAGNDANQTAHKCCAANDAAQ
jgi:hypothetical protein